jgi:hypothetical protein
MNFNFYKSPLDILQPPRQEMLFYLFAEEAAKQLAICHYAEAQGSL